MKFSYIYFLIFIHFSKGNVEYVSTYPYYFPYKVSTAELYLKPIGKQTWQFIVPPNMYASVRVMANFSDSDCFAIHNTANFTVAYNSPQTFLDGVIPHNVSETYHFPANFTTTIEMVTRKASPSRRLSFSFELNEIEDGYTPKLCVNNSAQVASLWINTNMTFYTGEVGKKMMISLVSGKMVEYEKDLKTDSCHIYEGSSCRNGKFISGITSLSQAYMESSTNISICCFGFAIPNFRIIYLLKPDCMGPNDTWISRRGEFNEITVTLNNLELSGDSNCTQYLTTYSMIGQAEYLETVESPSKHFSNESSFAIYVGVPLASDSIKLTENPLSDRETWLPQEVRGEFRTYVLKNTDAILNFAPMRETKWRFPKRSRKGFIMTSLFSKLHIHQYTQAYAFINFLSSNITASKLIIHSNKTIIEQGSFKITSSFGTPNNRHEIIYNVTKNSSDLEIDGYTYYFEFNNGYLFGPPTRGGIIYFDLVFQPDTVFYKNSIFVYSVIAVFCFVTCLTVSAKVVYLRRR